jgi:hypothetical protein
LILQYERKVVLKIDCCDEWNLVVVHLDHLLFWIYFHMVWKTQMIPPVVVVVAVVVDMLDDDEVKRTWNADSDCQCPW